MEEDMSFFGQLILALLVTLVTIPFLIPPGLLMIKAKADPQNPNKRKQCDQIRYFVGLFLIISIIIVSNLFINILAASFGNELAGKWLLCFSLALLEDFLLLQTIKCLLILCCISENAVSIFLDLCIGNGI